MILYSLLTITSNRFEYKKSVCSWLVFISVLLMGSTFAGYSLVFFNNEISFYSSLCWIILIALMISIRCKKYGLAATVTNLLHECASNRFIAIEHDVSNAMFVVFGFSLFGKDYTTLRLPSKSVNDVK